MRKNLLMTGVSILALTAGLALSAQADENSMAGAFFGTDDDTVMYNGAVDLGTTRNNTLNSGAYNGAAGITHAQQNNGANNSIGAATAVLYGIGGNNDVTIGAGAESETYSNFTVVEDGQRRNEIVDSVNGFDGIATVQQNNGDNNEIGAATAVYAGLGAAGDADQSVAAWGASAGQAGDGPHGSLVDDGSDRANVIDPSFTGSAGIATVQQNNGSGNAMSAATGVSLNAGAGDVDQEVVAGGWVGYQVIIDASAARDNTIADSFNGYSGIATVQQNNGDGNVMSAATGVVANLGNANDPAGSSVSQGATTASGTEGYIVGVDVRDGALGDRDNLTTRSFNGAAGVTTVQQNNGSNNVMSSATAVHANIGTTGIIDPDFETVSHQSASNEGHIDGVTVGLDLAARAGDLDRSNLATDTFNGYQGIATVQQNNGDNNMIGAATAVVANVDSHENTDKVLGSGAGNMGSVVGGYVDDLVLGGDLHANRGNRVSGSFMGSAGVLTLQQNNGNNNVVQSANAVVANLNSQDGTANEAMNGAGGYAAVIDNVALAARFTDRSNHINGGSFNGSAGVMTVQQNNGDNNVMGSANAVAANQGGSGFGPAASLATLGATVAGNFNLTAPTVGSPGYLNSVSGSFMGAQGVMVAQQNNGNNNAIQSAISVVANY